MTFFGLPTLALYAALLGLALIAGALLMRNFSRTKAIDWMTDTLDVRDWPAAASRQDGRVIAANAAWRYLGGAQRTVIGTLGPAIGVTPAEVYRMSRVCLQDGFAVDAARQSSDTETVALSVQISGADTLIWQVLPQSRLSAMVPEQRVQSYDGAPFGYVCFSMLEGAKSNDLFRELFADNALEILREQVDQGIFTAGRIVLPGRDGINRLALTATRANRSDTGESHEVFLFVPDSETASQVNASQTLEAIPVSLLHLDIEGRVFWGNAQARDMLGPAFRTGKMLGEIVQPLGRSIESLLHEVQSGRESGSGEMVRLRDGDFGTFAQISLTRMSVQGQPSLVAVLTDASELRMLEERFAQSQKMEAVGKLAGGVAHDFNNVLTAISGNCDLLLLRKDASHPDFSDLTQIRQNANRAAALVRQLLAFSRKQTLQPKLLSVQDVVSDTLYLLDRLIGETITLSLDHGRDLGSVRADNQQLEQALMNLVVNARDAMPNGGTVTIATRNRRLVSVEQYRGVSVPAGEYVEISVADNGTGIDPQVIDDVFDPFVTTKPQGEGTGLGLSTVYGIVKQSGGYIYAENMPGSGARFTILLPRAFGEDVEAAQKIEAVQDAAPVAAPDLTGQGAVMLVEDEAPVRSFASRALKLRGYRVIEAESAEAAMELLEDGAEDVEVLVSDVVMPGMDGPTFATKARALRPELRVVFISGYAEDSFRRNLKDNDFLFLSKPFSLNELTATVKIAMSEAPRRSADGGGDAQPVAPS
ncbi:MAG: ATP-binding protein [Pseudomonadota bacterium]